MTESKIKDLLWKIKEIRNGLRDDRLNEYARDIEMYLDGMVKAISLNERG